MYTQYIYIYIHYRTVIYIYIYVHVCMYVCIYIYILQTSAAHTEARVRAYMHTSQVSKCIYILEGICTYVLIQIHIKYQCVHTYIQVYVHMYSCRYISSSTYYILSILFVRIIYIYIWLMHTCTHDRSFPQPSKLSTYYILYIRFVRIIFMYVYI